MGLSPRQRRNMQTRSDNGSEFVSEPVQSWAARRGIHWHCIEPGKPTPNSHIERVNGPLRDE